MRRLVTVGIPVYKRLDYLPTALRCVADQDYPEIDLLVSDNGMNGSRVEDLVRAHYPRPWRFRQNPATVESAEHFNQIITAARGDYFVLLADDDEISGNFVSELATLLDRYPEAHLALSAQEVIDREGASLEHSQGPLPEAMSGAELVHAVWRDRRFGFQSFVTNLARTAALQAVGGFPHFTGATHDDDAVLLRLGLGRAVVLSDRCTFRWRRYDTSLGWSISIQELAASSREFLAFLDRDPTLRAYAQGHADEWREVRDTLASMVHDTYMWRWKDFYRGRTPRLRWMMAPLLMSPSRDYYKRLLAMLFPRLRPRIKRLLGRQDQPREKDARAG
jgi:glycosyltransferase involved in cell wall biosynthesis